MIIEKTSTHNAQEDACDANIVSWVNGELVHRDEAKVSFHDSGFMLGDGMRKEHRLR